MKTIEIRPRKLGGTIAIPPSKSVSHRAVMCAALAEGTSIIDNILLSDDIAATCKAMEQLGACINYEEREENRYTLHITGITEPDTREKTLDCIESGSTLRFMIPLLALNAQNSRVIGRGRLVTRPMMPYFDLFEEQGFDYRCETEGQVLPLCFTGTLTPGSFKLDGSISSQFITGLMFALPLLSGDSVIEMTSELESRPYVDITMEVLKAFGISIVNEDYQRFMIKGNQRYLARNYRVEGDFSQGAFWLVGGALGHTIDCEDLSETSLQGDRAIVDIMRRMGLDIEKTLGGYCAKSGKPKGTVIDVAHCPDLVPILAVLAALAEGTTEIIGAARLRFKESDRLSAITDVLTTLGADITEHPESLSIRGVSHLVGGRVDSYNDHRIAMAVAMASFACTESVFLKNPDCVRKSYPDFWQAFKKMGGDCHELNLGE